jgi:endonuclease YncB( thermonuclease family)
MMFPMMASMGRMFLWSAACVFLWALPARAGEVNGRVTGVLDGDTIEVLHNNRPERIRLSGIDCPEKGQDYGKRAKQAASALVYGKEVALQTHGLEKYGRTLADVLLIGGINVNHTLVKDGWCWWYRKYAPNDTLLKAWEKDAREAKRGLWANPRPCRRGNGGNGAGEWRVGGRSDPSP